MAAEKVEYKAQEDINLGELNKEQQLAALEEYGTRLYEDDDPAVFKKIWKVKPIQGEVTDKQLQAWKDKYDGRIKAWLNADGTAIAYFRKPDFAIMKFLSDQETDNVIVFNERLFDNCWLGGAEEFNTDVDLKLDIMQMLGALIKRRKLQEKKI